MTSPLILRVFTRPIVRQETREHKAIAMENKYIYRISNCIEFFKKIYLAISDWLKDVATTNHSDHMLCCEAYFIIICVAAKNYVGSSILCLGMFLNCLCDVTEVLLVRYTFWFL